MMRIALRLVALLLLVGMTKTVAAQSADDTERDSLNLRLEVRQLTIGSQASDIEEYGGKVSEFEVLDEGARAQLDLELLGGSRNSRFWLLASHQATQDHSLAASIGLDDVLRAKFDYSRFRHWLDHDPLAYGVEVEGLPPIRKVYKRDDDPGSTYQVQRSSTSMSAQLRLPKVPFMTAHTSIRTEARHGFQQAISYDMCQTCHITSRERGVNQLVSDYSVGAAIKVGKATVDYTFTYRDFDDNHVSPTNYMGGPEWNPDTTLFETWPTAPESWSDKRLFNNETLPYGFIPSHRKIRHEVDITREISPRLLMLARGSYATTENQYSEAQLKQGNANLLTTLRASRRLTINAGYEYQRIDNDDVLPTKVATLNSLMDTSDIYYPTSDNLINSALTRTTHKADVKGVYRLNRATSLLFGAGYGHIFRDNFGADATKEIRANVGITTRPFKKGRLKIEYLAAFTENPFCNPRAGKEAPPDTTYLNYIYSTFARIIREDPLSADPTDQHEVKVRLNGSFGPSVTYALGGNWKSAVNNDTEWESKTLSPYVNLGYSLLNGSVLNIAYNYDRGRSKTLFSAPDMILKAGELLYHHGSFYRLIPYDEDAHTIALFGLAPLSNKVSVNASAVYVIAKAFYNTADYIGVADHAEATDTLDLRDLNQFSQHEYRQLWLTAGMEYNLWSNVFLDISLGFRDFDNKKIYLYDMSGRAYSVSAAVRVRRF